MATIRGNDGSVTTDSNTIAKISSFEVSGERNLLDDTGMDDSAETFKVGFLNWKATITARLDASDTLGQKAIMDNLLAASPINEAYIFTAESGGANYAGNGLPISFAHRQQLGSIVEITYGIQGVGALAFATS